MNPLPPLERHLKLDSAAALGRHPLRRHRLDRTGGPQRHEDRRLDRAVRGREAPRPRRPVARQDLEADARHISILLVQLKQMSLFVTPAKAGVQERQG